MMRHISEIIGAQAYGLTVPRHEGHTISQEPKNSHKAAYRPDRSGFFAPGTIPALSRLSMSGGVRNKPSGKYSRALCGVLSLPAPLFEGVNLRKHKGGHMASQTPRASRANTQSRISANGTTGDIRWIRESTCIKRLRRHLAKSGCTLHVTREGSSARHQHGEYFITEEDGRLIDDRISLEAWLRAYGLMTDQEMIDPPAYRDWQFCVVRVTTENGISRVERLTRAYRDPAKAEALLAQFDGEGLGVHGEMISRKGGTHDA